MAGQHHCAESGVSYGLRLSSQEVSGTEGKDDEGPKEDGGDGKEGGALELEIKGADDQDSKEKGETGQEGELEREIEEVEEEEVIRRETENRGSKTG